MVVPAPPPVRRRRVRLLARRSTCPRRLPSDRVHVIPPSIDPFSPKNRALDPPTSTESSVASASIRRRRGPGASSSTATDRRVVERPARSSATVRSILALPLVVQVSRWDHLKDMHGVMMGFADGVVGTGRRQPRARRTERRRASPTIPKARRSRRNASTAGSRCPLEAQARIRLVSLPMDDVDENALDGQRAAAVQHGRRAEEPRRGIRPHRRRSDVEGEAGRRLTRSAASSTRSRRGRACCSTIPATSTPSAHGRQSAARSSPTRSRGSAPTRVAHVVDHFVGDRHLLRYATLLDGAARRQPDCGSIGVMVPSASSMTWPTSRHRSSRHRSA